MYNTTIFEQTYFWPLFVTFEVTALVGKRCFLKNSNEFRLFIYWSNFRTAEIGQILILVIKALLEQTLTINLQLYQPLTYSTLYPAYPLLHLPSTLSTFNSINLQLIIPSTLPTPYSSYLLWSSSSPPLPPPLSSWALLPPPLSACVRSGGSPPSSGRSSWAGAAPAHTPA